MNKYKEIKVGIMAILAAGILYFGFNYLKGLDVFSPDKIYRVEYSNIDGLLPSDRVIINGLQVGQVSETTLDTTTYNTIYVYLAVDKEIKIREGTVAKLIQTDLLGSKAIELIMSGSGPILESGASLIAEVDRGITEMITEEGRSAANKLMATVDKVNDALQPLVDGADDIREALGNVKDITAKWKGLSDQMSGTIEQLQLRAEYVTDSIAVALGSISAAANTFKELGDSLKTIDIKSRLEAIDETLGTFNEITLKINNGEGTIGQLMANDSLYYGLTSLSYSLDSLFKDMQNNPKRYVHFSLFGRSDKRPRDKKKKK